jgi:hypothetical protein
VRRWTDLEVAEDGDFGAFFALRYVDGHREGYQARYLMIQVIFIDYSSLSMKTYSDGQEKKPRGY